MYMYFIHFFQVSAAVRSLQKIYVRDEVEANSLFKIAVDAMNTYNLKIKTMEKTRELIKDNVRDEEYQRWSKQCIPRRSMQIKVAAVSIVIF